MKAVAGRDDVVAFLQGQGYRPVPVEEQTAGFALLAMSVATHPVLDLLPTEDGVLRLTMHNRLRLIQYEGRMRALYNGGWWSTEYTRADVRELLVQAGFRREEADPACASDPAGHGFQPWAPAVDALPLAGMDIHAGPGGRILIRLARSPTEADLAAGLRVSRECEVWVGTEAP